MKNHAKWLFIGLITALLINSMTLSTASAQELATETNIVQETMMPSTPIAGYYTDSSIQTPPSVPTPTTVTPKVYALNFTDSSQSENVTLYSMPQSIILKPNIGPLSVPIYKAPTAQGFFLQNTTKINSKIASPAGYPWYITTKDGNYWENRYAIIPKQPAELMYQANFTLNWEWDFQLNAKWYSADAMRNVNPIPPYYLDYSRLTAYNWLTGCYDWLSGNVSWGIWVDEYYTLNYTKYINPITRNCIIQIEGGEGQDGATPGWSLVDVQIDYIAVYTLYGLYTCRNASGFWQSTPQELAIENQYQYNNITISATNVSYAEGIDQFQANQNHALHFGDGVVSNVGQSFRPLQNNYFKIKVLIARTGNPIVPVEMTLYEAKNDLPIGPVLASGYILPEQLNPPPIFTLINFTICYHLNTSKSYIFTLQTLGPPDPVNHYIIGDFNAWDNYPPGKMSFNTGIWNVEPISDLGFYTYYFMESIVTLGYRTSSTGDIWSNWNSVSHKADTWDSHTFTLSILQNKTRYFQARVNLTSNSPVHLPNVSKIILNYYSYDWNYTILELDEFSFAKMETHKTIWQINISISLTLNETYLPEDSWIKIYNVITKTWNILKNGLDEGNWLLNGENLTTYYNGSLYLLFWYVSYHEPLVIEKNKDIVFFWRYYIYSETDVFTFNESKASFLTVNTSYTPTASAFLGNLSYLQNNSQWIPFVSIIKDLNVSLILAESNNITWLYFNSSFTIRTIIYTYLDNTIDKTITIAVLYYISPPTDLLWLILTLIGAGIATGVLIGYYLYRKPLHPQTIIVLSH
jgi:hypothetical protein